MRIRPLVSTFLATCVFLSFGATEGGRASELLMREIVPSSIDSRVAAFDEPNVVLIDKATPADRPLVVFFSGTKGRPKNAMDLLRFAAGRGYRVVGLEYDDVPAVQQLCPSDPDPVCAAAFRAMRVFGEGGPASPVTNPPEETIVARLSALLKMLDKQYPDESWGSYLEAGAPRWSRIIVCGLSQGAGMAAFIAKRTLVARAVLFSSPWDYTGLDQTPAPWLSAPSATPPDRWFAAYHRREKTAEAIQRAYAALRIPADHVFAFDRDLPPALARRGPNPFHPSTIKDTGYAPEWAEMFGHLE